MSEAPLYIDCKGHVAGGEFAALQASQPQRTPQGLARCLVKPCSGLGFDPVDISEGIWLQQESSNTPSQAP